MVRKISFMYSNGRPEKTLPEGLMIPLKVKMEKRGLQMVLYIHCSEHKDMHFLS